MQNMEFRIEFACKRNAAVNCFPTVTRSLKSRPDWPLERPLVLMLCCL